MERSPALAALALDFIQELPAQQSGTTVPFSGVLSEQIKLFQPEIEKLQGQIVSHASGDFLVIFQKPFNAVFCAISLHRMFAALSQALPQLESIQLRIGIYADSSPRNDTQAQQNSIDKAHALKELVPGGRIFVSSAIASTIGESFDLKPAGEHSLTAAAEPLAVFELMPPPITPLDTGRRFHLSQLKLPLAAALALLIAGSAAYRYVGYTHLTESALALWSRIPVETVQRKFHFLLRFDESSATSKTPSEQKEPPRSQLQPAQKELSPTEDRKGATLPPADEPTKHAVIVHPLNASPPSRAQAKPLPAPPQSVQIERQEVTEPRAQPQVPRLPPNDGSHTAAISIPKPRPRPAQLALQQMQVSTAQGMMAGSAEGPVSILPQLALTQNARVTPFQNDCETLRRAFDRGALAPSIDPAAYKRWLKCQQQKLYYNREQPQRVGAAANQQSADGGATSGSDGGTDGSGGSGGSGGKSNGRGNGKRN